MNHLIPPFAPGTLGVRIMHSKIPERLASISLTENSLKMVSPRLLHCIYKVSKTYQLRRHSRCYRLPKDYFFGHTAAVSDPNLFARFVMAVA